MNSEEYSPYKIVHHLDKLESMKGKRQEVPLQVQVVPTNRCQQNCTFCAYRMEGFPSNEIFRDRDQIAYSKMLEILDDFVDMGVKAVHYTGGGEPLVHPHILEIIKYTLERDLELALVTNGERLTEEMCEVLGDAKWLRVSVDAIHPDTYSKIRSVSKDRLGRVLGNIKTLIKYKRDTIIGVGFVVSEQNYKEIFEAAKQFKEIGVDNFRISASFTTKGINYFDGFMQGAKELSRQVEELADSQFRVFNLFNDRIGDMFDGIQDYRFCPFKELNTYIGADYNIYTCCTLAYNKKGLVGSIRDKSFKEVWEGEKKQEMFKKHNPSVDCQLPCMYKNKNDFINYCLKRNPRHINYI